VLTFQFSLRDVLVWLVIVGLTLTAFRLLSVAVVAPLTVVLLSSAVAWHLVENDWLLVALTGILGAVIAASDLILEYVEHGTLVEPRLLLILPPVGLFSVDSLEGSYEVYVEARHKYCRGRLV